jgi:hypothetical protein
MKKYMMFMAAIALTLNLTCFFSQKTAEEIRDMNDSPTLLIVNNGGPPFKVYLQSNWGSKQLLTGFLGVNEEKCVYLPRSSYDYYLVVENMDGEWSSPLFVPVQSPSWKWEINGDPGFDVLRLMPHAGRCQP